MKAPAEQGVSPLLPSPCHFQYDDRFMSPFSPVPRDAPRRCALIPNRRRRKGVTRSQHGATRWEGCCESRTCSRDTYPASCITKYTSIRRQITRSQHGVTRRQQTIRGSDVTMHTVKIRDETSEGTFGHPPSENHKASQLKKLRRRHANRFRGGLVSKAHRLVCHSTLGWRVIKKKERSES